MTSNPAFTERNMQKANAYLLYSRQEQKSLVTYHTLQSLYVCVWPVKTLISTAPIGSPIICMRSPAVICEQLERNLSFSSADVCGAGTGDEPLRTSVWEAKESHSPTKSLATTSKMWQLLAQRTSCNSSFFFPALSLQWSSPCSCDSYKAWTPSGIMTASAVPTKRPAPSILIIRNRFCLRQQKKQAIVKFRLKHVYLRLVIITHF